ncbi:PREDICTED: angiopoietin-related protein 7 isoform X2 [Drosophila arizonae]|uniref:Angiopoietin-related protein 7 isoform X2 n=1 Tax=Drosophila arizonae TaxID=7263 RepID=A0ABM1P6Y8_DROAR|nr:PREDICTED: angiopoietin-related protein 7 isoform X2 [Drosophila arizonae]
MGTPTFRLCLVLICCACSWTEALQEPTVPTQAPAPAHAAAAVPPAPAQWRGRNYRPTAAQHSEIKQLMTNLHDRVGILATLDEDQRHRLEVIDKKLDQLLDSNTGRMESLKAQQLNFQQRLDSFEHIQRLTRHTLDELKGETDQFLGPRQARELSYKQKNRNKMRELSRQTRDVPEQHMDLFYRTESPPTRQGTSINGTELDVASRLDALATFLVSLAYNVKETQQGVAKLLQSTNNIRRRLANRKTQTAQLAQGVPQSVAPVEEHATSCLQSYLAVNGILKLQLTPQSDAFYVPCQDDGWTVVMNRSSDDVSFERSWLDYKEGFGNIAGDFFIGLDKLHALTSSSLHELRIWMQDFENNVAVAGYDSFAISGERELYALSLLGRYQEHLHPPAGDSLSYHAGAKFSTFDSDNDNCLECSCAQRHKAGGWFNACGTSNLMGVHYSKDYQRAGETGIYWDTFQGKDYSLRRIKMLIRPIGQDEARR